jgi:transcription termination/antitermination protein NusA
MKNEFVLAFNEVLEEKQLPKEVILEALEAAMVSAYRRAVNASNAQHVEAKIDLETGKVAIFAEKEVVDTVQDERTEVTLEDACVADREAAIGGMVVVETTPKNFGRVAAQTARQVIQQRIREAERDSQMKYYGKQMGEIVSGIVQAVNSQGVTFGLDMKAEGIMPRNHQIPGERFRVHDRVRALLLDVKTSPRGPQILLSRAHRNFLRRLLENEVPEIYHGMVEIRSIAREPGQRSKVAVAALQPGVDPVGACVGIRGVRIQAIVRELNDEKIDVIEWSADPSVYIAKALSPARVNGVYLNEHSKGAKTATVVVPEDQLSLAIGRDGQNARLAAKLTAWRIDIKSLPEASADALNKLQTDPEYALLLEQESVSITQISMILAKKAEGRPVMPEEYQALSQFVDRVERGLVRQREKEKSAEEERQRVAQAVVPDAAYDIPLEDLGISLRYATILGGAGFPTVGDLLLQLNLDPDVILGLDGIGPKAMKDIEDAMAKLDILKPVEEEPPVVEVVAAPAEEGEAVVVAGPEMQLVEVASVEEQPVEAVVEEPAVGEVLVAAEAVEVQAPAETPVPVEQGEEAELVEEQIPSDFDKIFSLQPDVIDMVAPLAEDESEEDVDDKKRKKKKKKFVRMEYDPDKDVVVYTKKSKREDSEGWEGDW